MARKKIYAVKKGKTTGIFISWDECRDAVAGYPGAEYKVFLQRKTQTPICTGQRRTRGTIFSEKRKNV